MRLGGLETVVLDILPAKLLGRRREEVEIFNSVVLDMQRYVMLQVIGAMSLRGTNSHSSLLSKGNKAAITDHCTCSKWKIP
mmetsp:Transcript_5530/g.34223  ORF Transcript_5530/g.34223 Transcript_5530/m.34223 type:complete len:81 (-) Transcript_5530:2463-2705(-)